MSQPQRIAVIFNPSAQRGRAAEQLDEVRWRLRGANAIPDVYPTSQVGDAEQMAHQLATAKNHDVVVAAGGDGTINEVVNGLLGTAMPLGVLPLGTGNDFIKMMDLSRDLDAAVARLVSGNERSIDVGKVNGRAFANGVGIGIDAAIAIEAQKITQLSGMAVYVAALFRALGPFSPPQMTIIIDGRAFSGAWSMVTIGNGASHGGGFWVAPEAQIDDGLFDVCMIEAMPKPRMLWHFPKVIQGTHLSMREVRMIRGRMITIQAPLGAPVHVDGEVFGASLHELQIELLPQALRVRA